LKLWTEAPLDSEAKADPKDTGSRTDFSAKKQQQFHGLGIMAWREEEVSYHTQRATQGVGKEGTAHVPV